MAVLPEKLSWVLKAHTTAHNHLCHHMQELWCPLLGSVVYTHPHTHTCTHMLKCLLLCTHVAYILYIYNQNRINHLKHWVKLNTLRIKHLKLTWGTTWHAPSRDHLLLPSCPGIHHRRNTAQCPFYLQMQERVWLAGNGTSCVLELIILHQNKTDSSMCVFVGATEVL